MQTNNLVLETSILKSTPVTASNLVYEATRILAEYNDTIKNKL